MLNSIMFAAFKYRQNYTFMNFCYISYTSGKLSKRNIARPNNNFDFLKSELNQFKKYIKSNFTLISDGYSCFIIECPNCHYKPGSRLAYIIKKTGLFLCPNCDDKTNFNDLDKITSNKQRTVNRFLPYKSPYQNLIPITKDICDTLKISGLNSEELNSIGVLYNADLNLFHFPLKNSVNHTVGEKIYDISHQKELVFQRKIKAGLLICGAEYKRKAVIVSNIKDFLTLVAENLESYAVVCLPYFLVNLPQECLPAFEKFDELIFWFDYDSTDWDAARSISQKLNEHRCLLIRPTKNEPPPYIAYKRGLEIRKILLKATPILHKSITTFETLKQDILSELQNLEKVNGVKWRRFPILNKLLKGHRRGELTIITGPTGSGKTTFMSEYSLDLALQGVATLWGSFEIRNSRLATILMRQFVGYSLEKKLNEFDYWASEFEKYPLYFMTFHGQESMEIVMDTIEHARYVFDISHVIIDNLQFMMGTSSNYKKDKFWEQDEIISSFRSFATQKHVHVTLVVHPRKERCEEDLTIHSVFGSAKATQEADNVLIIQDKHLVSPKVKKCLQIAKNRFSGDLGIMPLEFDKEALSFSNLKKLKEY